jgi:proteasome assembly chaperone (PAC2) family protein
VSFLLKSFAHRPLAEIRSEGFYDLTQHRPVVNVQEGLIRSIQYPKNVFYAVQEGARERGSGDLLVFMGHEPHLLWPLFLEAFLEVARRCSVREIFTIGGLYDNIPHSVPPTVSGVTNHEGFLERFSQARVNPVNYQGPMSIHSELIMSAGKRGIPAASFWGHVPYYIQSSNPRTAMAVLERLNHFVHLKLDLQELEMESTKLDEQIKKVIQGKPDLKEYIEELEREYSPSDTTQRIPPPKTDASGDKIIQIDQFLRRDQGPNSKN